GGSTITQQLVKLSLLTPERTFSRKTKELVLSFLVERRYSKAKILEMYLNLAPYGSNVVGIGSAAERFFGKPVQSLDLAEASLLAGLPSAPSVYSPLTSFANAKKRQRFVLNRMVEEGYITAEQAAKAFQEDLAFINQTAFIRAPHFVDFVRLELESMYGSRYVSFSGLKVVTSLDLDLQDEVQRIIKEEVEKNRYLNISNGASVVLDARTGEILAMVGSADYFSLINDGVFNVAISRRQPGSAIKPLTYSLALMKGYRASSLISDEPTVIRTATEIYKPVNYDGKFHGKVSLRTALANSYNVAAINVLRTLDLDEMVELGKRMGLTNWEADGNYGLSLTLGGLETRLLDLTNLYATLARKGVYVNTKPILSITDSKGHKVYDYPKAKARVIPEGVSYIITSILTDYKARIPAFGINNNLSVSQHTVAVKTGTTDEKRDNYTVGYTPSFAVGVWMGNNNNSPMNPYLASGISGAAPAWNKIMTFILSGTPNEEFDLPSDVIVKVYPDCNNLREYYLSGTEPGSVKCETKKTKEKQEKKKKDKDEGN
ncbi:transglycosylase domain-containing protein, partial [candidate division WWE3 bacterium]|nr:transglycosylase domain-containing protein [candidate division WWE3 bacterium]